MKALLWFVLLCYLGLAPSIRAQARPPYPLFFKEMYECDVPDVAPLAAGAMKCTICHVGVGAKARNEYGKALSKHMTKEDFFRVKANRDGLESALQEAFKKTESEKSADGRTFGERLKAGKLPTP